MAYQAVTDMIGSQARMAKMAETPVKVPMGNVVLLTSKGNRGPQALLESEGQLVFSGLLAR